MYSAADGSANSTNSNAGTPRPVPAPRRLLSEHIPTSYENVTIECTEGNDCLVNVVEPEVVPTLPAKSAPSGHTKHSKAVIANTESPTMGYASAHSSVPMPLPRARRVQLDDGQERDNTGGWTRRSLRDMSDVPTSDGAVQKHSSQHEDGRRHSSLHSSYGTSQHGVTLDELLRAESVVADSASNTTLNLSVADSTESSDSTSKYKAPSPGDLLKSLGTTSKLLTESIGERVAFKARGAKNRLDRSIRSSTELFSSIGTGTSDRLRNASKSVSNNFSLSGKGKHKDKNKQVSTEVETARATATDVQICGERPQTMPPNIQVFNSISFNSPLDRKLTGGILNLCDASNKAFGIDDADASYEVPRSANKPCSKMASLDMSSAPPSYDDVLRNVEKANQTAQKSKAQLIKASTSMCEGSKAGLVTESHDYSNEYGAHSSDDFESLPLPKFPPPELSEIVSASPAGGECIYGFIKPVRPPARQKRNQKNYEVVKLRSHNDNNNSNGTNNNMKNADLTSENVENQTYSVVVNNGDDDYSSTIVQLRETSARFTFGEGGEWTLVRRGNVSADLSSTAKPQRSESWEFYGIDGAGARSERDISTISSTPEPIYANEDMTYGKVFEVAGAVNVLTPAVDMLHLTTPNEEAEAGACFDHKPPRDIIKEFDPLTFRSGNMLRADKSNELLLLEHLLEEDTYGTIRDRTIDCNRVNAGDNTCNSDEDNLSVGFDDENITGAMVAGAQGTATVQHSGLQLSVEQMEDRERPFLSRLDDPIPNNNVSVDLARPSNSKTTCTKWFLRIDDKCKSTARSSSPKKVIIDRGESPPSYLEAIGESQTDQQQQQQEKYVGNSATKASIFAAGTTTAASRAARFMNPINMFSTVKSRMDAAIKRRSSFRSAEKPLQDANTVVKPLERMIARPSTSPLLVRHEGPLVRFPTGVVEDILKEMQNRKAILRDKQFQTYLELEMKTPKECILLDHITSVQCITNSRITENASHFYCFEITCSVDKHGGVVMSGGSTSNTATTNAGYSVISANCKYQRTCHLYGVGKESERDIWLQKLLESLAMRMPLKYTYRYYRSGWCYLKNSVTSEWSGTWLVLSKARRRLTFITEAAGNVEKLDLRKARCVVLKECDDSIRNLYVESGPILMIDCPPYSIYMVMCTARETKIWRHIIIEVAHNNGFSLNDQQLTKFNVPVVVDKCINFIYIHGSMSEGIYRKSGAEQSILRLLAAFRADAFNVEITRSEYNEHDVANVLKRFMRDLPERLLSKQAESFICVSVLKQSAEKIPIYKELLTRLSDIERETLKRIVGHLVFINSQRAKNKMNVQNLTMIWGPTMMSSNTNEQMAYSQKEADVLADLMELHKDLFPLKSDELKHEQQMLACLHKYYAASESLSDVPKRSGDLKIWITLNANPTNTIEEKLQVNATITPTKTAYEVCQELSTKMQLPAHELALYEVILDDNLERPLHHSIEVFGTILNWSLWSPEDRKNNYLVVKPFDLLRDVQRAVRNSVTITPGKELKFADCRSKSFKPLQCELRDGKIVISKKDKNDKAIIMREIFLQSSTVYLGTEKKRDCPYSWSITFVEPSQIVRSRDSPFIGHVLAGSEWVDRILWYSSIWYSLYGDDIMPPAEIILK